MLRKLLGTKPAINWYRDQPPGIRAEMLLLEASRIEVDYRKNDGALEQLKALMDENQRLGVIGVKRCQDGEALEKKGDSQRASLLYQASAIEMYVVPFPYNRLRVIYTKLRRPDLAIKACQDYINAVERLGQVGGETKHYQDRVAEFREWIAKIEAKEAKGK